MVTLVQLLRFSRYLSGFVLGKQIDYSAVQVVVRWMNEALKAAPSGFESIVARAGNLGDLVCLTSGWGFHDIWNAFLTDVIPPADDKPLEILEKFSSFSGGGGKNTSPERNIWHY